MITEPSEEQINSPFTPGRLLRENRERAGFSEQDIADSLNLKLDVIKAIESNDFAKIAAPTFAKGYLRSYAKLLGVDDASVLELYKEMGLDKPETRKRMKSFSKRTKRESNDNKLMLISYVIFFSVVGLAVVWWWQQNQQTDSQLATPTPSNLNVTPENLEPSLPQLASAGTTASFSDNIQLQDNTAANALANTAVEVESTITDDADQKVIPITTTAELNTTGVSELDAQVNNLPDTSELLDATSELTSGAIVESASEAPEQANFSEVIMTFSQDCWIEIIDNQGERIAYGVKKAGRIMTVKGEAPFAITLGIPENVSIQFESEPVDISHFKKGIVARFSLPLVHNNDSEIQD